MTDLIFQDEEIEIIYAQMEADFGMVTYEAWLALLVSWLSAAEQRG